jgi:hypothetical protein
VLIAAGVVFVVGLIGNVLTFSNRFVNALVTAVVYAAIFAGLIVGANVPAPASPVHYLPAEHAWLELVLIGAAIVFAVDLVGNALSFSNRFVNALVTAIVFAVIFGGLTYVAKEQGLDVPSPAELVPAPTAPTTPTP